MILLHTAEKARHGDFFLLFYKTLRVRTWRVRQQSARTAFCRVVTVAPAFFWGKGAAPAANDAPMVTPVKGSAAVVFSKLPVAAPDEVLVAAPANGITTDVC